MATHLTCQLSDFWLPSANRYQSESIVSREDEPAFIQSGRLNAIPGQVSTMASGSSCDCQITDKSYTRNLVL